MSFWQAKSKRKQTGARLKKRCKKRKYELGRTTLKTQIGPVSKKFVRCRGGGKKIRLRKIDQANITDPSTGVTKNVKILKVIENPANVEFTRKRILTKGAKIETELGVARITSRINQIGFVNAVLINE